MVPHSDSPDSGMATPLETRMADISDKTVTRREALARGRVRMMPETLAAVVNGQVPKGDVLTIARIAGIQGAKRCPDLIPLCHPLLLTGVEIELTPVDDGISVEATVRCEGRTGVEMEALCAVSAAALTIYDMCKPIDKAIVIDEIMLISKRGGKSGDFSREQGAMHA